MLSVKIKLKSNVGCSLQSLQAFDAATNDDEVDLKKTSSWWGKQDTERH
jgi:hypothetical protein